MGRLFPSSQFRELFTRVTDQRVVSINFYLTAKWAYKYLDSTWWRHNQNQNESTNSSYGGQREPERKGREVEWTGRRGAAGSLIYTEAGGSATAYFPCDRLRIASAFVHLTRRRTVGSTGINVELLFERFSGVDAA